MCLGGPSMPAYKPLVRKEKFAGPASPDDRVNTMTVENINDRSQQDKFRQANRGSHTTSQSSKTDKAY